MRLRLFLAPCITVAPAFGQKVNPQPALAFARLLQAQTLELDSDCGHLITTCENQKIAAAVARFLAD